MAGIGAALVALVALLASEALPVIILAAALWAAGNQAFQVVTRPYLTEHSDPEHRNELFAIQFAIQQVTNIVAAVLGGVVAAWIASAIGLPPGGPGHLPDHPRDHGGPARRGAGHRHAPDRRPPVADGRPPAAPARASRRRSRRPAPVADVARDHDPRPGPVREAA